MAAKRSWLDQRVDLFLKELARSGLNCSRAAAEKQIRHKLTSIAEQVRLSETNAQTYLTDEMVREMARLAAAELADEAPGSDPSDLPPTHTLPTDLIGRTIAALSIAAGLVHTDDRDDRDDSVHDTRQVLDAMFMWGIMIQRSDSADVATNEALVHRTIRHLDRTIAVLHGGRRPLDGGDPAALAESMTRNVAALHEQL